MEAFISWFNDPLVQSVVISPLVGAVLGVLFAGLNAVPSSAAPSTVQQTIVTFNQTIVVKNGGRNPHSSEDGLTYLFMAVLVIGAIVWCYSMYSSEILGYWKSGLFSCAAFILSAGIASGFRGQYSSSEWVWYIFAPIGAIAFSFYLIQLAQMGVIAGAREAASQHTPISFYFKVLQDKQRTWLMFQVLGVVLGVLATLTATLRSVHYLALMNQRTNSGMSSLWRFLARGTIFSSSLGGMTILIGMVGVSYLALSGVAYQLWRNMG